MTDLRRFLVPLLAISAAGVAPADDAADLGKLAPDVFGKEGRKDAAGMLERDIARRTALVNARDREEWAKIDTRDRWERFRDARVERLRRVVGRMARAAGRTRRPHERHRGGRRLRYRERRLREPAGPVGPGQSVRAPATGQVDAGHPDRPCPPRRQGRRRTSGHGHDLGAGRLPRAGHRPGRLRRTPVRTRSAGPTTTPSPTGRAGRTTSSARTPACNSNSSATA